MLLLPEIPILRPILSMFGFGPSGPVEGEVFKDIVIGVQK